MSGTLFIVCIPTGDKEKTLKDNDVKDNKSTKSFTGKKSSDLIVEPHKVIFIAHPTQFLFSNLFSFSKGILPNEMKLYALILNLLMVLPLINSKIVRRCNEQEAVRILLSIQTIW